jgi:hypothetical protein
MRFHNPREVGLDTESIRGNSIMSKYYQTADDFYALVGELFKSIPDNPKVSGKLLSMRLVLRGVCEDPVAELTMDASDGKEIKIFLGPCDVKPTVEIIGNGDNYHLFWLGRKNLMLAITKGEVKAKGPYTALMKILPLLSPLFKTYQKIVEEKNPELLDTAKK